MNITITDIDPRVINFTKKNHISPEEFYQKIGVLFLEKSDFTWEEIIDLSQSFKEVREGKTRTINSFGELKTQL